ncbi:MAG: hypothetical protein L3J10_03910 [Sulfurimonas sp.]|nr:hypothetical protein [Sulfurimonas sp.]
MCNFNKLNDDTKVLFHLLMKKSADSIGGANFLLALLEAMKDKKPNALMLKGCQVHSDEASIKWNKIIFKDKLDILEEVVRSHKNSEEQDFNILESDNQKKKKKILNMVKTLAPIEFVILPVDSENGAGFNFKVFESIENDIVKINPLFVAMFFCSTEYMKKALKYKI